MVLLVPEVSKCSINSEQEIVVLCNSATNDSKTRYNLTQLSYVLQLSLETDKILELFFKQIKQYLKLTKLVYIYEKQCESHNSANNISIVVGSRISSIHTNNKLTTKFQLFYKQEFLGEINFASKTKFTPNKLLELQSYVKLLILPLKNSLLYTEAVHATKIDPLTGISNRLCLVQDLQYHFNFSSRYNSPLSIIFLDIDYFKKINDQFGHIVGDKILINLADMLKLIVRKSDKVYRFGGEEFVIILEHTNSSGAENLARKLKSFINKKTFYVPVDKTEQEYIKLNLTISMGISSKNNNDCPESLMNRADSALYVAKNNGRNKYIIK